MCWEYGVILRSWVDKVSFVAGLVIGRRCRYLRKWQKCQGECLAVGNGFWWAPSWFSQSSCCNWETIKSWWFTAIEVHLSLKEMDISDLKEAFHLAKCWDLGFFHLGSQTHLHSASGRGEFSQNHVCGVSRTEIGTHHLCSLSVVWTSSTWPHWMRECSLVFSPEKRRGKLSGQLAISATEENIALSTQCNFGPRQKQETDQERSKRAETLPWPGMPGKHYMVTPRDSCGQFEGTKWSNMQGRKP